MWPGTAASGAGRVWEESRGWTNTSFAFSADGATLELRVNPERPEILRSHRFELQNLPPPASVVLIYYRERVLQRQLARGRAHPRGEAAGAELPASELRRWAPS